MTFSDLGIDSSTAFWRRPSATGNPTLYPSLKTDFTITDKKTGQKIPFGFIPYTGKLADVGQENLGKFGFRIRGNRTDALVLLSPHQLFLIHCYPTQLIYNVNAGC
jgi:hypothetical protein